MAYPPLERQAWRWLLANEKAMEEIEGRKNCMVVRYEEVCAQPIDSAAQLLAFAGLRMHDQTRAFLRYSTSGTDPGYYTVRKDPLVTALKWRESMAPEVIARVLAIVRDSRPGALYMADPMAVPSME
jgi:hypothetical protein